jgi:hypothetical protein
MNARPTATRAVSSPRARRSGGRAGNHASLMTRATIVLMPIIGTPRMRYETMTASTGRIDSTEPSRSQAASSRNDGFITRNVCTMAAAISGVATASVIATTSVEGATSG